VMLAINIGLALAALRLMRRSRTSEP
jgi:hypothetical protein